MNRSSAKTGFFLATRHHSAPGSCAKAAPPLPTDGGRRREHPVRLQTEKPKRGERADQRAVIRRGSVFPR